MIAELNNFEKLLNGLKITNLAEETECREYFGFNFNVGQLKLKFRKSKITPKKVGQFVTLWKRDIQQQTIPCSESDNFDFYIFASQQNEKIGYFIFSKRVLIEKSILSTEHKEGKRGFRLYPTWATTESAQAKKTQNWQTQHFIDLTKADENHSEKLLLILSDKT